MAGGRHPCHQIPLKLRNTNRHPESFLSKLLGLDKRYHYYFGTASLQSIYLVVFLTKHFSGLTLFNSPQRLPNMILAVNNLENSLHTSATLPNKNERSYIIHTPCCQCVSQNEYNHFVPHLNIEILFYFLLVMQSLSSLTVTDLL